MQRAINQPLVRKALKHLKAADSVLSEVIKQHGACTLKPSDDAPFHALASSIISQQISASAARSIKGKLFSALGEEQFTPENILGLSPRLFKEAGLSRPKQDYLIGIALAIQKRELDFDSLTKSGDEEITTRLTSLRGVGKWTAEMFLIFGLGRPDILSLGDVGLKRGFKQVYGLKEVPSEDKMLLISEPWRPYRSIASWYLWRTID
jgi:DNA-3-methyladenine glycosylase II